ncbi:hypothetical protein E4U57_005096 [Claviceps arundinis]|uniref:Uncharacterized protein n=1 Tax=Claviceps arundinis TaxID=1623583 RepID=A0ABQ7P3X1_9HYPO|nr:hypothetical protein E4U57_005096 [Claviceps arundinis]
MPIDVPAAAAMRQLPRNRSVKSWDVVTDPSLQSGEPVILGTPISPGRPSRENPEPSAGGGFQTPGDIQQSGSVAETLIRKLSLVESVPQPKTVAVSQPEEGWSLYDFTSSQQVITTHPDLT